MAKAKKSKSAKTTKTKSAKAKVAKTKRAKASTSGRTVAKSAGKPVVSRRAAMAATAGPSDEELDLRNRLKSGPRRQAGPPLSGDMPERAAMRALREEVVPDPTDPKEP
jgi:hypothetical protein